MDLNPTRTVVLAALAAFPIAAQSPTSTLALTDNTPLLAQIDPACNVTTCNPALGPAVTAYAGGTAHDPRDRMTWISDGLVLTKVDPRNACATICVPFPAPALPAGSVVTGLAFNEQSQRLFIAYSDNRIAIFNAVGCALSFVSECFVSVPPNHVLSGLATDDSTNDLYFASAPWLGSSSVPFAQVYRAPQFTPCMVACPPFPVDDCAGVLMTEITGLAFRSCRRQLKVTDGFTIVDVQNANFCQPQVVNCCSPGLGERMTGLCILPSTEVSGGNPCFGGTSPVCTNMRHVLGGDPTIGNLGFSLDLVDAPSGYAFLFLGLGPCGGTGTTYGFFCNNILPPFYTTTIAAGLPCSASASVPFPLPNLPFLCGITLCSQYAGMVPPAWSGHFVSNHLSWTISSS